MYWTKYMETHKQHRCLIQLFLSTWTIDNIRLETYQVIQQTCESTPHTLSSSCILITENGIKGFLMSRLSHSAVVFETWSSDQWWPVKFSGIVRMPPLFYKYVFFLCELRVLRHENISTVLFLEYWYKDVRGTHNKYISFLVCFYVIY
jgi:hypothetical protein